MCSQIASLPLLLLTQVAGIDVPEMRIGLIHATDVAVDPITAAFAELWPEAEIVNILEDSLSVDRAKSADLTPDMMGRISGLGHYALNIGCDGVLFTCSAFGPAIEAFALESAVPVLKPNEAMFEAALATGNRTGMIYTFEASRDSMEQEFREAAETLNPSATISSVMAPGAMDALRDGDADTHNALVADAVDALGDVDAIILAQFSTSRAADAVRARTDVPVLTSPDAAVEKMKRLVTGG